MIRIINKKAKVKESILTLVLAVIFGVGTLLGLVGLITAPIRFYDRPEGWSRVRKTETTLSLFGYIGRL